MKKLLAIFLFALMLCTLIPFATVSAAEADKPTIQIYVEETELNAGDEFEVTVNLLNIPEPGLIGALVDIAYDHDVFELVTYYDEDEEAWLPQIEVGSKYNASSNRYIMFGPIDENGVAKNCNVQYLRATASATQVRYEEHFFTATFKVKDDAASGEYSLTMNAEKYNPNNFLRHGNLATDFAIEGATITIGSSALACEHTNTKIEAIASDPSSHKVVCADCDETVSENVGCKDDVSAWETIEEKPATCTENGHKQYYMCPCGNYFRDSDNGGYYNIGKDPSFSLTNEGYLLIPAGHTFNSKASGELASEADCTNAATYYVQCDNCDAVSDTLTVEVGEAKGHGHTLGFRYTSDGVGTNTHTKYCNDCDQAIEGEKNVACADKTGDGNHACDANCGNTSVTDHIGGTAYCTQKAVCDECGQPHGDKDSTNHASDEVTYENVTATTHDEYHKCCGTLKTANVPHNYNNAAHKCDCGKVETFTFTWIKENGDVVYAETVEYGKDAQSVPEVPYGKPGYTASWSHNGKGITEDTTITMVFTENTYRVEVYSANGNTLLERRQHKYTTWISTNVTNFNGIPGTGTSLEGHGFVGFSLEPNGEKVCSTIIHRISVITDNAVYDAERGVYTVKLYVVIAPLQYYISYWVDGRIYASEAYEYGAAITPETRIPHKDQVGCSVYTFAGWDKEIPETMPAGNVEIHATFTETKNHTGKPVYTNNGDTHSATYDCCDGAYVTDEAHDYNTGDADYTCTCGATFTGWEGKTYYENAAMVTGWHVIDNAWYYFNTTTGVRAEGITRVPYPEVAINGVTYAPNASDKAYWEAHKDTSKYSDATTAVFYFDEDGKFVQYDGIAGKSYFIDGMAPWHVGMVKVGNDYYYFAGDKVNGGNVMATDKVYATRDFNSGLTMNGTVYYFGDNGKLIVENGIQKIGNDYFYYENGVLAKGKGVVKMTDKDGTFYIYVRSNGQLATGKYWPTTRNGYLERGEYDWGTDGKYYPSTEVLDGIVADGGNFYYYVNGKKQIGLGVVELIDEEGETFYIYVRSNGQLATGKYWPTTRNDYLERGEYDWGTDGKYYPAK
ncbi:MAG: hypothetical protein E7625_02400 [Ruminococcaceae bacterium]|nr:hypothetical protein [Oscillospiraceae bacterium]